MLQEREIDISQFISFNYAGLVVADYDQILAALIKKYKEVYGYDIDLSNTTADGVFVYNLALIINNILQSFKTLYSNLDVNTATGHYLDALCRLSNVTRKQATKSTAELLVTSTVDTILYNDTRFIDSSGNEWVYRGNDIDIIANAQEAKVITVECTEFGPVSAPAGSISQTIESSNILVEQVNPANEGENEETDEELRARRDLSNGSQGVTVLESLVGNLLNVTGIDDVFIINNNHDDDDTAADGTTISKHDVYIVIRFADNIAVSDETVGNIIYNTMTPGIGTTPFTGTNGTAGSYSIPLDDYVSYITQTVYWKKATPIHPSITLTVVKGRNYTDEATADIKQAVINYLNNIHISQSVETSEMIIAATYANTTATYVVTGANADSAQANPNTYFKYNIDDVEVTELDNTLTFTFK